MQQLSSLRHQRGASVTTIIVGLAAAGIIFKLGIAIIPAYVGDYQLNKLILDELKKANDAKLSEKKFLEDLATQMTINANYNTKINEVLTVVDKTPGALTVKTNYTTESVFYGNTVIVNRFSADIDNESITKSEPVVEQQREKLSLN